MWAQGLTVGLLIVAGALTHSQRVLHAEEVCKKSFFERAVRLIRILLAPA